MPLKEGGVDILDVLGVLGRCATLGNCRCLGVLGVLGRCAVLDN